MALMKEDEIVEFVERELKRASEHVSERRICVKENYDFAAGKQWSQEDILRLEESGKVPVVFNYSSRVLNAITGIEQDNRQDIIYLPREMNDSGAAETATAVVDWLRDGCDAEDEESDAFRDCVIGGEGWIEVRMDYESNPDGEVLIERVDPLEMIRDPDSKRVNYSDAKWIARQVSMTKQEFKKRFPKQEVESFSIFDDMESIHQRPSPTDAYKSFFKADEHEENRCQVAQFQWYEMGFLYKVNGPNGLETMTESAFNSLKKKMFDVGLSLAEQGIRYVKIPHRIYRQIFYANRKILNKDDGPEYLAPVNNFSFLCVTGFRDRNENNWFGMMDVLKPIQKVYNKQLQQMLFILSTNAKGGYFAETDAFGDIRRAEAEMSQPNSIVWVNPGALANGKIQPKVAPPIPESLPRLLEHALQSITAVPGVSLEMLGMSERDQPAILEFQRREAGVTILATFFKSLRKYRKQLGRVLLDFIRNYMTDGRLVRIVGAGSEEYIPLLKDITFKEYDVSVDDQPSTPNHKMKVFGILSQILPMALQSGIPIPNEILDYMPLPDSLTKKWKEQLQTAKQPNPSVQQLEQLQLLLQQLEVEGKAIENEKLLTDIHLNKSKALHEQAIALDEFAQAKEKESNASLDTMIRAEQANQKFILEEARKQIAFILEQQRKSLQRGL